jgi:uncharacterized protein
VLELLREEALELLRKAGCSEEVVEHCKAVERVATKLAQEISRFRKVNIEEVIIGSLLHDIGRARTHGIRHGVEGGEILRKMGAGKFAHFAENHIGAGIPAEEAERLGLPRRDFLPSTLEEKIVAYADKLVVGNKVVPFEEALEMFRKELGEEHPAIERLKALHEEIEALKKGF